MKLRVVELLLITTVPTMILAAGGWPGWLLVVLTLVGGTAAAGAANAFNMVYDRDIDAVMNRTRNRPLVTGAITVREALVFATALALVAVLWFGFLVNWVAAGFTVLALLLYVVGYTMILKRRTPQNIIWGGTAGCMPVLIGWSAVTGSIAWEAVILFGIIFFWTPPQKKMMPKRMTASHAIEPVTADHPIRTGMHPAVPPQMMFCGVRRLR